MRSGTEDMTIGFWLGLSCILGYKRKKKMFSQPGERGTTLREGGLVPHFGATRPKGRRVHSPALLNSLMIHFPYWQPWLRTVAGHPE